MAEKEQPGIDIANVEMSPLEQGYQGLKSGTLGLGSLLLFGPGRLAGFENAKEAADKYNEVFGITNEPQKENYLKYNSEGLQTFDESKYLKDKTAYLAGEGFGGGGLFGLFKQGLSKKLAATGILGTENLITNTAIGSFTDDPTMRLALSLPAGVVVNGQKLVKNVIERKTPGIEVDPETGIPLTSFQKTGKAKTGALELDLRMNPESADTINLFELSQNKAIDGFFNGIQKFATRADLNPSQITNGVYAAYKNYNKSLVSKLRSDADIQFTAAKNAGADPVIQLNSTRNKIQELIASVDKAAPGASENIADFKKILAEYPGELTGQTQKYNPLMMRYETVTSTIPAKGINIDKLQQQLSAWSDAASTGRFRTVDNTLVGVNRGQARMVLRSLQDDLDRAIVEGAPGAKELRIARDNFKENVSALNKFNDKPLTKYFDKKNIESLTEEDVVKKLTDLPFSQKNDLLAVLGNSTPELADSVRKRTFTSIWEGVTNKLAPSGDKQLNTTKALTELNKLDPKDIRYLFPTQEEFNQFKAGVKVMQDASRKIKTGGLDTMFNQAKQDASLIAGSVGGAQARYQTLVGYDMIRKILNLPANEQAILMFDPKGREALDAFRKGNFKVANTLWEGLGVPTMYTQSQSATNLQLGKENLKEKDVARKDKIMQILQQQMPVSAEPSPEADRQNQIKEILLQNKMLPM
jgi:hypothetical protein